MGYAAIKVFIPTSTRAKYNVLHGNQHTEELLKLVDPSELPKEYGGEAPELDATE